MVLRILAPIGLFLIAVTGVSAKETRLNGLSDPKRAMNVGLLTPTPQPPMSKKPKPFSALRKSDSQIRKHC